MKILSKKQILCHIDTANKEVALSVTEKLPLEDISLWNHSKCGHIMGGLGPDKYRNFELDGFYFLPCDGSLKQKSFRTAKNCMESIQMIISQLLILAIDRTIVK